MPKQEEDTMKIETYLESLVSYAMNCGLAQPEDHVVLINRLLQISKTKLIPIFEFSIVF